MQAGEQRVVPEREPVSRYFERYYRARSAGGLSEAVRVLEQGLQVHSRDSQLLIEAAKVARELGDWRAAVSHCEAAVVVAPDSVPILCEHGLMLRQAGRPEESVLALCGHLETTAGVAEVLAHLAWGLVQVLEAGGLSRTVRSRLGQLRQCVELQGQPSIEILVGLALGSGTPSSQQLLAFLDSCKASTLSAPLVLLLIRRRPEDVDEAVGHALGGGSAVEPAMLGHLYKALSAEGRPGPARALLFAAQSANRSSPELMLTAVHATKQGLERMYFLDSAIAQFPNHALLRVHRARLVIPENPSPSRLEDLRVARDLAPNNAEVALELARGLKQACRLNEALAVVDTVRQPSSIASSAASLLYSELLEELGDLQGAETVLREVLVQDPACVEACLALVDRLVQREATSSAVSLLIQFPVTSPQLVLREVQIQVARYLKVPPLRVPQREVDRLVSHTEPPSSQLPVAERWGLVRLLLHLSRAEDALALAVRTIGAAPLTEPLSGELSNVIRFCLGEGGGTAMRSGPVLASELVQAGLRQVATRQTELAALNFLLGRALAPDNEAAALNAGFFLQAAGHVEAAKGAFARVRRVYRDTLSRVAWPAPGGVPWPWGSTALPVDERAEDWPRITVITPSYNQGQYIEETIRSVVNQGYPNLQYIVVDGASTDGTAGILQRYSAEIDHLVCEPDNGQTDAINKGLRLADGDMITWLNSDDLYAPGALLQMGRAWRERKADVLFGICVTFREYALELANLPAVTQDTFTPEHLADIFNFWMKGHYFYQPEVVFSRKLLNEVGGSLNESLYYTMDYDLWMRFAAAGARVEAVNWPICLFRQHKEQKTHNLTDCVLEQAQLRDHYVRLQPPEVRRRTLARKVRDALAGPEPTVAVVSARMEKIFSPDSGADLAEALEAEGVRVHLYSSIESAVGSADLVILLMHLQGEEVLVKQIRTRWGQVPVVGWFWDNHHHLLDNIASAEGLDLATAGHAFAQAYLASEQWVQLASVPLCVTQWSEREARSLFREQGDLPRDSKLYGGFVRYEFATARNELVEALAAEPEFHIYFLQEDDLARYFGLSQAKRFREWSSFKVSLCLPLLRDLSQRLFDALLTGQVPIVPADMPDLDQIIPRSLQQSLPIVRFSDNTVQSVRAAHLLALKAFDAGGEEGVARRHQFALEHHLFPSRVSAILRELRRWSRSAESRTSASAETFSASAQMELR